MFTQLMGSERVVMPGARVIGPADPLSVIEVTVKLRRKQAMPAFLARPTTVLTRDQLAEQYGAADADIDTVVQTFNTLSLTALSTAAITRTIKLSGAIAAFENAFQVTLVNYADADGSAHTDFPGSSVNVLSVGGTTIPTKGAADIPWKAGDGLLANNGGSTGGGVSSKSPRPVWQNAIPIPSVNPGAITGRCLPDIATNADFYVSPYLVVVDGASYPTGGTSAAAPLLASLITRINAARATRVGFLPPVLYQTVAGGSTLGSECCADIVTGDKNTAQVGGYSAGPGYDCVSGWGTPNGKQLAAAIPV